MFRAYVPCFINKIYIIYIKIYIDSFGKKNINSNHKVLIKLIHLKIQIKTTEFIVFDQLERNAKYLLQRYRLIPLSMKGIEKRNYLEKIYFVLIDMMETHTSSWQINESIRQSPATLFLLFVLAHQNKSLKIKNKMATRFMSCQISLVIKFTFYFFLFLILFSQLSFISIFTIKTHIIYI